MADFFKKVGSFFGLSGGTGAGGTRDAFEQYGKYIKDILPRAETYLADQFGKGQNPYLGQLAKPFEGLETGIDAFISKAQGIPALLRGSALASTEEASRAAATAARGASGRSVAFSTAAGTIASRAAQEAATQQSSALANAVLQGEQFGVEALQAGSQMKTAIAGARSGAMAQEANLYENRFANESDFRKMLISQMFGLGQTALGAGIQGQTALHNRKAGFWGGIIQAGISAAGEAVPL